MNVDTLRGYVVVSQVHFVHELQTYANLSSYLFDFAFSYSFVIRLKMFAQTESVAVLVYDVNTVQVLKEVFHLGQHGVMLNS